MDFNSFIKTALEEDVRDGDHSTLSCIPADKKGKAILKIKEKGILAGIEVAKDIFLYMEPAAEITIYKKDGEEVNVDDIAFEVVATIHTILKAERLVLNIMQRMGGIATLTNIYANKIKNYPTQILDTRKTTPNFRWFEKRAVVIGGGHNHRMGLYDMIMLKDNHIDYCGGIEKAIEKANEYLKKNNLNIPIEIETRSIEDVQRVVAVGNVQRIMLDNFTPEKIIEALKIISVGSIIHHAVSMDMSLKAVIV